MSTQTGAIRYEHCSRCQKCPSPSLFRCRYQSESGFFASNMRKKTYKGQKLPTPAIILRVSSAAIPVVILAPRLHMFVGKMHSTSTPAPTIDTWQKWHRNNDDDARKIRDNNVQGLLPHNGSEKSTGMNENNDNRQRWKWKKGEWLADALNGPYLSYLFA